VHYKELKYDSLLYSAPLASEFRKWSSDSLEIYYSADTSLDLVNLIVYLDRSNLPMSRTEKATLQLLEKIYIDGGTSRLSPQQVRDSLEFNAASLTLSIENYSTVLRLTSLKEHFFPLLGLLQEASLQPGLDTAHYSWAYKKWIESLNHQWDAPQSVLGSAFEKTMTGQGPETWVITPSLAKSVSIAALKTYTSFPIRAPRVILAFTGPQSWNEVSDSLLQFSKAFIHKGNMDPSGKPIQGPQSQIPQPAQSGVYLVPRDLTQGQIRIGFPGLQRPHPDYYALQLASTIFGSGGFTSRLVKSVRTEAGFAYSVRSYVESDYKKPGTLGIALQTKVASTLDAVALCLYEINKARDSGFTQEEFDWAKQSLLQSLPGYFETPVATAEIFAENALLKRPDDHFRQYKKALDTLTLQEVNSAFARYFVTEKARIVLVGPDSLLNQSFDPQKHIQIPWNTKTVWPLDTLNLF